MAELITWTEKYSVGIEQIDKEHKKLVQLLNSLHNAMLSGQANKVLGAILNDLINYTATHFKTEDSLFDKFDYPETQGHKEEHSELVSQVVRFKKEFDSGATMLSIKLITFLKNWLILHIVASDKEYTNFFHEKGIY